MYLPAAEADTRYASFPIGAARTGGEKEHVEVVEVVEEEEDGEEEDGDEAVLAARVGIADVDPFKSDCIGSGEEDACNDGGFNAGCCCSEDGCNCGDVEEALS